MTNRRARTQVLLVVLLCFGFVQRSFASSSTSGGTSSSNSSAAPASSTSPGSSLASSSSLSSISASTSSLKGSSSSEAKTDSSSSDGGGFSKAMNSVTGSSTGGSSGTVATTNPAPTVATPVPATPVPQTPAPTGAMGAVFVEGKNWIFATDLADTSSADSTRQFFLTIRGVDWSENWCFGDGGTPPEISAVIADPWSFQTGVVSQISSLVGSNTIECNASTLILTFAPSASFFLPFNDTVTFSFSGSYAMTMASITNEEFVLKFVADQVGAYPPTPAPPTPQPPTPPPATDPPVVPQETDPPTNATDANQGGAASNMTLPEGAISWTFYNGINALATVAALGTSAAIGGPFSAAVLRGSIISPQSCAGANADTKLPFALHPTQVNLGMGGPKLGLFVSAALMNTMVMVGIVALHAMAAGAAVGKKKSLIKGFGLAAFPGSLSFAGLQLLGPGIVGASLTVLLNGDDTVDGGASGMCIGCIIIVVACYVGCLLGLTKFFFARGIECGKVKVPWVIAPTVLYGDRSKRRRGYVDAFGRMFVSYSYKKQWFPIVDQIILCAQMGLLATRPDLENCDGEIFIPTVVVQILYLFGVLVFDPLQNFFDRCSCFILTLLVGAGGVAGAALKPLTDGVYWATIIDRVGMAISFVAVCYCIAAIALTVVRQKNGVSFRAPDCGSEDDSDDDVMKDRAKKKAAAEAEAKGLLAGKGAMDPALAGLAAGGAGLEMNDMNQPLLKDLNSNHEEEDPEVAMVLLRGQWIRLKDPHTGQGYYYNTETQETSWDLRNTLGMRPLQMGGGMYGAGALAELSEDDGEDARWRRRKRRKEKEKRRRQKEKSAKKSKKNKNKSSKKPSDPVQEAINNGEWKEHTDESGKVYYVNAATGKKTWDLYEEMGVPKPVDKVKEALDSGEWKEIKDGGSGKSYFHNPKTNETTWDLKEKLGVVDDDNNGGSDSDDSSSGTSSSMFDTSDTDSSAGGGRNKSKQKNRAAPNLDTLTSLMAMTTPMGTGGAAGGGGGGLKISPEVQKALDSGEWIQLEDPNTKAQFFYNTRTQQTTNDLHALLTDVGIGSWISIPDPNDPSRTLLLNTVTKAVKPDPNARSSFGMGADRSVIAHSSFLGGGGASPALGLGAMGMGMGQPGVNSYLPDPKGRMDKKTVKRIKRLLKSGEWIMFVDPLTKMPCYRHAETGRISFDLAKEVKSSGISYHSGYDSTHSAQRGNSSGRFSRHHSNDTGFSKSPRSSSRRHQRSRDVLYDSEEDDLISKVNRASRQHSNMTGTSFADFERPGAYNPHAHNRSGSSMKRGTLTAAQLAKQQEDQELYDVL